MNTRLHGYLGLANRARKALVGEAIVKTWEKGKIKLLIIALDASERNAEKLTLRALDSHIATLRLMSKAELGSALGLSEVSAVAITEPGLARRIIEVIEEETP